MSRAIGVARRNAGTVDLRRVVETFAERGVVRVPGAFTRTQAAAMSDAIWRHVARATPCRRHDPSTWDARPISFKKLKSSSALLPLLDGPPIRRVLDALFGPDQWTAPKVGPQILMTLPNASQWRLPHRLWHTDAGFESTTFPVFGVKLFGCVEAVRPGGGGTLTIAGSHRAVERYRRTLPHDHRAAMSSLWSGFMRHDPWLAALANPRRPESVDNELLGGPHDAGGIPLEVVELTGDPGDVWVTHLHTFHCVAPNAHPAPRVMVAAAVMRRPAAPG
jgi:hypothetical protein